MDESHVLSDLFFDGIISEVDFLEESVSDIDESFFRPILEPINSSSINESGEHTSPNSEFDTDG
jgi:hypothetical protein